MAVCPACRASNPDGARYCAACATPLPSAAVQPPDVRKTVTVLFCDVSGSTALGERLDPETLREVMLRYFGEMRSVLERHGGTVEKFIGDAVVAIFGVPVAHEDDALRAVRAAEDMRSALGRLNEHLRRTWDVSLEARIGIQTGEVVTGGRRDEESPLASGDVLNVAARLQQMAAPGEVLVGEQTYRLLRSRVRVHGQRTVRLRGKKAAVVARLLDGVEHAAASGAQPPLVGRKRELERLVAVYAEAQRAGVCHTVMVLGPAGIGKSRLADELARTLDGAVVATGRCVPYGEGITYGPVTEILRQLVAVDGEGPAGDIVARLGALLDGSADSILVADHVARLLEADGAPAAQETFWAIRRFIEQRAAARPPVLVFEDLHWAQPLLLDLIEYIAGRTRAPVLIVCVARPELFDERSSWALERPRAHALWLEPLEDEHIRELAAATLGDAAAAESVGPLLVRAAEGNPLFARELLAMLVDDGTLRRTGRTWQLVDSADALAVPPTIAGVLDARIDHLTHAERTVLQLASLIGREFAWAGVLALADAGIRNDVGTHLHSLVRKQLVVPDEPFAGGGDVFRFAHVLIREAAYRRLPKALRAELHERYAEWLLSDPGGTEPEEVAGYHFEQAYAARAGLAPSDPAAQQLAERAAALLGSAGRKAFARGEMTSAAGLLTRATVLLRDDDEARLELMPELGTALLVTGQTTRGAGVLERGAHDADRSRPELAWRARLILAHYVELQTRADAREKLRTLAAEAIHDLTRLGDDLGLAQAKHLLATLHMERGAWQDALELIDAAIANAERAGDRRTRLALLNAKAASLYFGPTPAARAIEECELILERGGGDRTLEAATLSVLAALEAMQLRFDAARTHAETAIALAQDLDRPNLLGQILCVVGTVELLADNAAEAERVVRRSYEMLMASGDPVTALWAAVLLSDALADQGKLGEVEAFAAEWAPRVPQDDVSVQSSLRRIQARVAADRQTARAFAAEAVRLADRTDAPILRAEATFELARALADLGKLADASLAARDALRLYEAKGNAAGADRARRLLPVAAILEPAPAAGS